MNQLKIFESTEFGQIRVIMKASEPWFVANDVCRVLELGNPRQALTRLDDDEKGVISTDTLGGKQELNTVNEPGLYSLVLGSRKPEAKEFKRWLTHEVIPSIRKTGVYGVVPAGLPNFMNPIEAARAWIDVMEKKQLVEAQVIELAPKAEVYDAFVDRNHAIGFRELARELGVKETILREFLVTANIAYRQKDKWKPHALMVEKGYMLVKDVQNSKTGYTTAQALWTMPGKEYVRQKMQKLCLL